MGCEMDDNAIRATKYRKWAAEIRGIAEDIRGKEKRNLLLKVAKDYDHMALNFEAMDQSVPSVHRA
jgi:hypothetical protein